MKGMYAVKLLVMGMHTKVQRSGLGILGIGVMMSAAQFSAIKLPIKSVLHQQEVGTLSG